MMCMEELALLVIIRVVALLLLTQGCSAGWRRVSELEPFAPRQQVQVWHQGRALRWHALHVGPDSVSGIPYVRPITCASCRLAVPRGAVDSIRVGDPIDGFWKTVALVAGVTVVAGIAYCWPGCVTN